MSESEDASPRMDWALLKERMRQTELRLQAEVEPTADQIRERLQQRAARLAVAETTPTQEALLDVLVFEVSEELYAIETRYVEEVLPLRQFTPIPCTPAFVLGVMNVRGRICSILDLRRFFELPLAGLSDRNVVVALSGEGMEFCLLAERMVSSRTIAVAELQEPLSHLAGIRADYLLGVTHRHWAVLDAGKLLQDPRLVVSDAT